jgi:two-component system phosphate regulon response regulator PhoB
MNQLMQQNPLLACSESAEVPPATRRLLTARRETRGTVVIAEDDAATRALLCHVLTRASFTVHACENGRLACDAVRREAPDVVLLDWMMPVMDGPAAVEYLRGHFDTRGIPVVMLSTQSAIEERVIALKTGVQDFMTKPFDPRELVARIDQQIRWRRLLAVDRTFVFDTDRLFNRIWGETPRPPNLE